MCMCGALYDLLAPPTPSGRGAQSCSPAAICCLAPALTCSGAVMLRVATALPWGRAANAGKLRTGFCFLIAPQYRACLPGL